MKIRNALGLVVLYGRLGLYVGGHIYSNPNQATVMNNLPYNIGACRIRTTSEGHYWPL